MCDGLEEACEDEVSDGQREESDGFEVSEGL